MFGLISGALGVASGIKGLFSGGGKQPKQLDPYHAMKKQVAGARDHGEAYGFNPLTLLQYGATGGMSGGGGGSTPPLASVQAITDGLRGMDDVLSGDQARRRQADQLELDLAKIRLDEAKRGVGLGQHRPSIASSGPLTGNRAATVAQPSARSAPAKFSQGENPVAPGRKDDIAPLTNSPGVFEIENRVTGGKPITIPGEGEPWGLDELATAAIVGVPQILGNAANDYMFGGKSVTEWWKDNKEKRESRDKEKPDAPDWDAPFSPHASSWKDKY